ncbi:MAG: hypothetical protein HZB76_05180 [Chlamydiae bacterium]|nr:hypothetical protein [Chlamydiota bacterium]
MPTIPPEVLRHIISDAKTPGQTSMVSRSWAAITDQSYDQILLNMAKQVLTPQKRWVLLNLAKIIFTTNKMKFSQFSPAVIQRFIFLHLIYLDYKLEFVDKINSPAERFLRLNTLGDDIIYRLRKAIQAKNPIDDETRDVVSLKDIMVKRDALSLKDLIQEKYLLQFVNGPAILKAIKAMNLAYPQFFDEILHVPAIIKGRLIGPIISTARDTGEKIKLPVAILLSFLLFIPSYYIARQSKEICDQKCPSDDPLLSEIINPFIYQLLPQIPTLLTYATLHLGIDFIAHTAFATIAKLYYHISNGTPWSVLNRV